MKWLCNPPFEMLHLFENNEGGTTDIVLLEEFNALAALCHCVYYEVIERTACRCHCAIIFIVNGAEVTKPSVESSQLSAIGQRRQCLQHLRT